MNPHKPLLLILSIALGGCQASRLPADGSEAFDATALSPDAPVVTVTGSSRDSWESLQEKLLALCRQRQPNPGINARLQILDQRELEQVTETVMPMGFSGAAGADTHRFLLAPSPTLKSRVKIKKLLGLCQYPAQP